MGWIHEREKRFKNLIALSLNIFKILPDMRRILKSCDTATVIFKILPDMWRILKSCDTATLMFKILPDMRRICFSPFSMLMAKILFNSSHLSRLILREVKRQCHEIWTQRYNGWRTLKYHALRHNSIQFFTHGGWCVKNCMILCISGTMFVIKNWDNLVHQVIRSKELFRKYC